MFNIAGYSVIKSCFRSQINLVLVFILLISLTTMPAFAEALPVSGWIEFVTIDNNKLQLEAKVDTGADNSSINAKILKKYTLNNEKWISFQITNKKGEQIVLERKISRYANIKRKLALPLKRPVVYLGICMGKVYREAEVNLADRSTFKYQLLIGRNYLRNKYLVDSASKHLTVPECN